MQYDPRILLKPLVALMTYIGTNVLNEKGCNMVQRFIYSGIVYIYLITLTWNCEIKSHLQWNGTTESAKYHVVAFEGEQ